MHTVILCTGPNAGGRGIYYTWISRFNSITLYRIVIVYVYIIRP